MFLSRLRTHPRDLMVLRDLGDLTELHRTVMRAFPKHDGDSPRAEFGVLFRVEVGPVGTGPDRARGTTILVQSAVEPTWANLPEGYLLEHEVRSIDEALNALKDGRRYRFRLVANPSKKVGAARDGEERPRHSRRVGLLSEVERLDWLARKAEQSGFELVGRGTESGPTIADVEPVGHPRNGGVHVRPARFEGLLEVRDAVRFRGAVEQGVGPARAYGCGLLSLAPAR